MGCNCKSGRENVLGFDTNENVEIKNRFSWVGLLIFIVKTFLYLISLVIILPIIFPFTAYILFKTIYLNESVNVTGALVSIGTTLGIKDKGNDEDYDDDDEYDEEDLVMMDVEDITDEEK